MLPRNPSALFIPLSQSLSRRLTADSLRTLGSRLVVLCCVVSCCAVLCCAVLCCVLLCCAVLCCAVLCFVVVLFCVVLCYVMSVISLEGSSQM